MFSQYCFLCASDEGVFLDVARDNPGLVGNQLEACLSTEVNTVIKLSNKICYKCAYELDQCAKFVQKYKKSQEASKSPDNKLPVPFCCLCFDYIESGHIFDITKDNRAISGPLQKIYNIFNENLTEKYRDSKLICLTCRYNLDVLYDLKRLHKKTVPYLKALVDKEIDYSNFPKVPTDVINRKTTITTFPDNIVYILGNSDSDSNDNMPRRISRARKRNNIRSKTNVRRKLRNCDKCHKVVTNGNDMYRFHCTGLTVCKNCWITMDPSKGKAMRRSRKCSTETKLCTVFLKDVLSEKVHKVESDNTDKIYIISDESSREEGDLQSASSKMENRTVNDNTRKGKKRMADSIKSDIESKTPKIIRLNQIREHVKTNEAELTKVSDTEHSPRIFSMRLKNRKRNTVNNSDSDITERKVRKKRGSKSVDRMRLNRLETEDAGKSKKRLKSILEGIHINIRLEPSDKSSSDESNKSNVRLKGKRLRTVSVRANKKLENKEARHRTRSCSISSKETSPPMELKSLTASSEVKMKYICEKCDKKFDTKLLSAEHNLTHFKQIVLKLQKLSVTSNEEKQLEGQIEKLDSQEDKTFKEAEEEELSNRTPSVDKNVNDPSEEIAMNIEDDSEEDIINSSKNEDMEAQHDANTEKDKVIDKSDAVESETREEQAIEIQNDETVVEKRSEQLNKTIRSGEIEQDMDSKTSMDKDVAISNGEDVQETTVVTELEENSEDLNVEKEQDTMSPETHAETSATKEEKLLTECNNEKKHSCNEITSDDEAKLSSVSLTNRSSKKDKDQDGENCDHSENCKNNDDETVKDEQSNECDLTTKSLKKELREEKNKTTSDSIDMTETLSNDEDLDDLVLVLHKDDVDKSTKQPNKIDKENKETNKIIDVDESNTVENSIQSDLLDCKNNKVKDNDKNTDDILAISDCNNDSISVESKKVAEKATDDLTNKDDLTKHVDDLEQLIEKATTKSECEIQEIMDHVPDDSPTSAANEILKEVFDLATAEVQKRENRNLKNLVDIEIETLENISLEIRNSADMPSLDPICVMDDENDMTLNC